jgi:hypothetical protein
MEAIRTKEKADSELDERARMTAFESAAKAVEHERKTWNAEEMQRP